jgi:dolichol-phosphate mannosyltransferase
MVADGQQIIKTKNHGVELPEPWRSADVVVVLPTYQEAENLPVVMKVLMELPLPSIRVLVVDDNSPDGTGKIADQLAEHYGHNRVGVVHRQGREGLGKAYLDGMARAVQAGAEFVVQMDSDLSHGPEYLPGMLGALLSAEADAVIGSRYVVGATVGSDWPWHRKGLSAFANTYVRALLHLGIRDVTAGYKIWRASALEAIGLGNVQSNGYSFQVEMNYRARLRGLKIVELPIHFSERAAGESKMSLKVQLESAAMPFKLKRYARQRT